MNAVDNTTENSNNDQILLNAMNAEQHGGAANDGSNATDTANEQNDEQEQHEEPGAQENQGGTTIEDLEKMPETKLQAFEPDALEWMRKDNSILHAWAPLRYTGYPVALRFAQELNRPLKLVEAQYMVQADGEVAECAMKKGEVYQPTKFVAQVPKGLRARMEAEGKTLLTEMELEFCGCFYVPKQPPFKPFFLSGPLFDYVNGVYKYAKKTPLGGMAIQMAKRGRWLKLGLPLEQAVKLAQDRYQRHEEQERFNNALSGLADLVAGKQRDRRPKQRRD